MKHTEKVCPQGHRFFKSSSCPVCPVCEKEKNLTEHVFSSLSAPARRALEQNGISSLEMLAIYSENEILKLHGLGKSSIPKIKLLLQEHNLNLRT